MNFRRWMLIGLLLVASLPAWATDPHPAQRVLEQFCFDCHGGGKSKGDVRLDAWETTEAMISDHALWERVQKMLATHEMPPSKKPQPSPEERQLLLDWIDAQVYKVDCENPNPGRVTLRRLNRAEYNNTVRDLLGIEFTPADDFPVDDSGHGFDNIAAALSLSPGLMEKYLKAAGQVLAAALGLHRPEKPETRRYSVDLLEVGYNAKQQGDGWVALNTIEEDDVAVALELPCAGEYAVRVRAYARQDSDVPMKLTFMRDKWPVTVATVATNRQAPQIYESRIRVPAGNHRLRAVVRRNKDGLSEEEALRWKSGTQQAGAVVVQWMEIEGPVDLGQRPETFYRLFGQTPATGMDKARAGAIVQSFARRAYRRAVTPREVDNLFRLVDESWKEGLSFEEGIEVALRAVLVSPHFLFRGDAGGSDVAATNGVRSLSEYALASRLSYFLWSSMPDDALFAAAEGGILRANIESQVRRMLGDPKARALVDHFAGQWLELRNLDLVTPDPERFAGFDEELRQSMKRETEMLFATVIREDRSIVELLDADYTYVNARLAKHYGLPDLSSDGFQRVSLQGTPRRGLLTQASILTLTSNPTRTSPVKRGKWVLENLLNAPPPPPPPGVPELKEGKELTGSLRQRMEEHRANPLCSSCHEKMDAIGFALENYDAVGVWREKDGEAAIEAAGSLGEGLAFNGSQELVAVLRGAKREQFVRCLVEKMLIYALGRGTEYYDKCAINRICQNVAAQDYRFSALVLEVVRSVPFQMTKDEGDF